LNTERRKIAELKNDPANARKHSPRNLKAIRDSLDVFGQQKPIVIDSRGVVIAGNGTLEAARELGWDEIDVVITDLDPAHAQAFGIADNRTAELAEWDTDVLGKLLEGMDSDLADILSMDDLELPDSIDGGEQGEGLTDPDEVPEPPEEPITQTGDLWLLGEHRLLCGDSTSAEDVGRLMDGEKADMLLSDPPYGVSYVGKTKESLTIKNDQLDESSLTEFIRNAFNNAEAICRSGAYWFATVPPGPLHLLFAEDWKRRGILRQIMVWAKDSLVLGHSEYHYQHEPILFGWIAGDRHKNSDRTRTTLWEYDRPKASREHPTMKPVPLWAQAVTDGSRRGEVVYDPFLGSGTTLIAAEQLGRKCYGMEIDPQYCDVIVKRWEDFTGQTATRENERT